MTLKLSHTQRLNLHAIIGAQRASVDEMRLYWRIQDRINLSDEEKTAINFRVVDVNGQERSMWEVNGAEPKEYDFTQDEVQKVGKVVKEWQPGYLTAQDRIWLEPLLGQLENGSGPTQ